MNDVTKRAMTDEEIVDYLAPQGQDPEIPLEIFKRIGQQSIPIPGWTRT